MKKIFIGLLAIAVVLIVSFKPLAKSFVQWYSKGVDVTYLAEQDKRVSTLTTDRWGKHTALLADRNASAAQINESLQINADPDLPGVLTNRLKSEIVRFVQAYSDGSFEAIRDFYVSSNSFVISNVVMDRLRWQRKNPPTIKKLGEVSVLTPERHAEIEAEERAPLVSVPYDPDWEMNLRELYTNQLKALLTHRVAIDGYNAAKSSNPSWSEKLTDVNNRRTYERIQTHIENVNAAIAKSPGMKEYVVPWESLSLDLLQVRVIAGTTDSPPNVFQANAELLNAAQYLKPIWASYELTPDQICQRDGHVCFAVFQTAVKPKGTPYYCPLTVGFYYNPHDTRWRVCALASHPFLAQSIPL